MTLTQITEKGIKDGEIVNADINDSAAIHGSKIDPSFSANIHVINDAPKIFLNDGSNNPDFSIQNANGAFVIFDDTNAAARIEINADGHIDFKNNVDCEAGLDVTGAITSGDLTITSTAPFINFIDSDNNDDFNIQVSGGVFAINNTTDGVSNLVINSDGRIGINKTSPTYQLECVGTSANGLYASGASTTAISTTFGASANHILRSENSELAIGLANVAPFHLYIQGRLIQPDNSSLARHIALNPLGGEIAIGSHTYENIPLHVQGQSGQTTVLKLKSSETTVNQQWQMVSSGVANSNMLHQFDGLSFNTYTPSLSGTLELQHQINHHGITLTQGKGINFYHYGVGTNIDSNKLDDYEQGTFTPSFQMSDGGESLGYSHQSGRYTKIGNNVHVEIDIRLSAINSNGSGSYVRLLGLPFTSNSSQPYGGLHCPYYHSTNNTPIRGALVEIGANYAFLYHKFETGSNIENATVANAFTSSTRIILVGSYTV